MTPETNQHEAGSGCPTPTCSAFPIPNEYYPNGEIEYGQNGMTLRDYFAASALQAIIAHPQGKGGKWNEAANDAFAAADAMMIYRQNSYSPETTQDNSKP